MPKRRAVALRFSHILKNTAGIDFKPDLVYNEYRLLKKFGNTSFAYDANGLRIKKGSKEYIWSGDRLLGEVVNGDTIRYYYDASGIAGYEYRGAKFAFRKNLQGDVIGIIDSSGTLLGTYEYDAWGNCTKVDVLVIGTTAVLSMNPFRYRGYYYDSETGLYYLQSRYYDPQTGRFISPDAYSYLQPDTVNGLNLYSYCNNNPVMNVDPSGCFAWTLFFVTLGVSFLIGFGASAVGQIYQYGWSNVNYGQAAVDGLFSMATVALTFTGIGRGMSMALNGLLHYAQYLIDADFHNERQTLSGAIFAIGSGILTGALNGAGTRNLKELSKSLYKGIATATSVQLVKHMITMGAPYVMKAIMSTFVVNASNAISRVITSPNVSHLIKRIKDWLASLI